MRRIRTLVVTVFLAGVVAAVAAASTRGGSLSLVGYSTPKAVMGKIIQLWQQTPAGRGVSFSTSYGPSGDQARAVAAGLKADLVFLSTGDDVDTLVDAGLVDRTGTGDHFHVLVQDSSFDGLPLVEQHKLVYAALTEPLQDGTIHELRITTKGAGT